MVTQFPPHLDPSESLQYFFELHVQNRVMFISTTLFHFFSTSCTTFAAHEGVG